jgi:membrane protease YdiL (CAAX protease family)
MGGLVMTSAVATGQLPGADGTPFTATALAGGIVLLGGLVFLALRALRNRRHLPPDRYRGPSIFLLLFIVLTAGNLLALPFVASSLLGPSGDVTAPLADPFTLSVLLAVTPVIFIGVSIAFVLWPSALSGLRLTDGPATARSLAIGLVAGVPTWVVATIAGGLVVLIYQAITGSPPEGDQAVLELIGQIPPPVAIVAVGILAPIGEELFFRGVAFNGWEREYGARRAIIGSALLFAAIHLVDGAWLAFAPILVVGLVLGIVYARTRSLPITIGIHGSFNLISIALLFIGVQ